MRRKIWLSLLAAAVVFPLFAAGDLDELRGLVLTNAKLPIYNKQVLQLMAFCRKAERQGQMVVGFDTLLDIIRRGADVDEIKDGWGVKLYPLDAKLPEVFQFWKGRLYSEGIMFTSRAEIEQETRMAAGGEPVFFRSPLLDLDGVGFEADFNRRTVLVRSDVRIVVRMGDSDPRKLFAAGAKLPENYEFVSATGDSLLIDMNANQILLIGNVRIDEARSGIDCDRMTIFLDRKSDEELRMAGRTRAVAPEETLEGVSRILCDGNVVIARKLSEEEARDGVQQALADHMVYELAAGTITLTGDGKMPRVMRGRESLSGRSIVLFKDEQRATVNGECLIQIYQPVREGAARGGAMTVRSDVAKFDYRSNVNDFLGNVRIDEPRMELTCAEMRVTLREDPAVAAAVEKELEKASLGGLPEFGSGGRRELDRIICEGGVKVVRKDAAGKLLPDQRAVARRADFDYASGRITMTGDKPTLYHGNEMMTGRELVVWINEERLSATRDSEIVLCSATVGGEEKKAAPAESKTTITSDSSDLNYGGNKLVFIGNVKVRDPRMKLDCDRLELLMTPRDGGEAAGAKKSASDFGTALDQGSAGNKMLTQVNCFGNVHIIDPQMDLKTDNMTLFFRELKEGEKQQEGMFQSKGTQLSKIVCDGNLVLVNIPDQKAEASSAHAAALPIGGVMGNSKGPRTLKAARGVVDLVKNTSEFHDKVSMVDDQGRLKCEEMYIYATKIPAGTPVKVEPQPETKSAAELLDDADPLMEGRPERKDSVPQRIALNDELELSKVICRRNVELERRTKEGELQQAGGHEAVYTVADKRIVMTGTETEQPWMGSKEGRIRGNRILVNLEDESMKVDGNTVVDLDKLGF